MSTFRAEGALSIVSQKNIVEDETVLKKKKTKSEATSNSRSEKSNEFWPAKLFYDIAN